MADHAVPSVTVVEGKYRNYIFYCNQCNKEVYVTRQGKYRHYRSRCGAYREAFGFNLFCARTPNHEGLKHRSNGIEW